MDVVKLNVSGRHFQVLKEVLLGQCILEQTSPFECYYFKSLLSGKYKKEEETFLDRDSDSFAIILNHLRGIPLSSSSIPKHLVDVIKVSSVFDFESNEDDCNYYGLYALEKLITDFEEQNQVCIGLQPYKCAELTMMKCVDRKVIGLVVALLDTTTQQNLVFKPGTQLGPVTVSLDEDVILEDGFSFHLGYMTDRDSQVFREDKKKLGLFVTKSEPISSQMLNTYKSVVIHPQDDISQFTAYDMDKSDIIKPFNYKFATLCGAAKESQIRLVYE